MGEFTMDMQLKNNLLEYREKLTIPSSTRFGLEFELENVSYDEVSKLISNNFDCMQVKRDKSLKENSSAEITTTVLQNNKKTWIALKKLGVLLDKLNPSYNNCSFQVNFDGELLPSMEDRIRFLKIYALYEDIIYRFSKGNDDNYRSSLDTYAYPIILSLKGLTKFNDKETVDFFSNNKRYGVVFKNKEQDLIEFRTPNMTSNPMLWQNYITTFYYLLKYASTNRHNKKELDEYIDKFCKIYILENYSLEKKEKALSFAEKVFPNQVDRINFMHQYLKK